MKTFSTADRRAGGMAVYVAACLGVLLLFLLVGVCPSWLRARNLEREAQSLQQELRQQEILQPLQMEVQAAGEVDTPDALALPDSRGLHQEQIPDIPSIFGVLAESCGLELVQASPHVPSLADTRDRLRVDVSVRGGFLPVRDLLIELGRTPYVIHIEEVAVHNASAGKETAIKVWLAID